MVRVDVAPGAVWLKGYLSADEQALLASEALALLNAPVGGYVPTVRGGGKMRVRMLSLGRHWNPLTYRYETMRADHDGAPAPAVPADWAHAAGTMAAAAGFADYTPDICLINWYGSDGRLGLHQDKDESRDTLERGAPVVSVSLGDMARFLFGGHRRREPVESYWLESGDVFVFGGPARLRYHGVARTAPVLESPVAGGGRINLTFRTF